MIITRSNKLKIIIMVQIPVSLGAISSKWSFCTALKRTFKMTRKCKDSSEDIEIIPKRFRIGPFGFFLGLPTLCFILIVEATGDKPQPAPVEHRRGRRYRNAHVAPHDHGRRCHMVPGTLGTWRANLINASVDSLSQSQRPVPPFFSESFFPLLQLCPQAA